MNRGREAKNSNLLLPAIESGRLLRWLVIKMTKEMSGEFRLFNDVLLIQAVGSVRQSSRYYKEQLGGFKKMP
jgi:hypothetical protein